MCRKVFLITCLLIFSMVLSVNAAGQSDFADNPIDKYYFEALCNNSTTAEERLIAEDYIKAWAEELRNVAGNDFQYELAKLEEKAEPAMNTEMAKWNGGTGGPGAGMIAYGQVYRDRALELMRKNGKGYVFFIHSEKAAYMPLLKALANSQAVHYDAFNLRPDEQTANLTMYNVIAAWSLPILRGKAPTVGQAYCLRQAMEDPKKPLPPENIKPESLYSDIFVSGVYNYSPKEYKDIVAGAQMGIVVTPRTLVNTGEMRILGGVKQGDTISLRIFLSRLKSGNYDAPIGQATVVLRQDAKRSSGFVIVAYNPVYGRFEDVNLF